MDNFVGHGGKLKGQGYSSVLKSWVLFPLMFFTALSLSSLASAVIDTYEFSDPERKGLFIQLTEELRCPKCQNQNLAGSNSPIASDMRREIHRMVEEGQSEDDVVDFMVARYGDFVRYKPKRDRSTAMLWYGPILLLAFGALVVVFISRRDKSMRDKPKTKLADKDQERLKRILDDDNGI